MYIQKSINNGNVQYNIIESSQKAFLVKITFQNRNFGMRYIKDLLIPKLYFGIHFWFLDMTQQFIKIFCNIFLIIFALL